jgi:hypothetical protein
MYEIIVMIWKTYARWLREGFPCNVILDMIEKIRSDSYTALRRGELPKRHILRRGIGFLEARLRNIGFPG